MSISTPEASSADRPMAQKADAPPYAVPNVPAAGAPKARPPSTVVSPSAAATAARSRPTQPINASSAPSRAPLAPMPRIAEATTNAGA